MFPLPSLGTTRRRLPEPSEQFGMLKAYLVEETNTRLPFRFDGSWIATLRLSMYLQRPWIGRGHVYGKSRLNTRTCIDGAIICETTFHCTDQPIWREPHPNPTQQKRIFSNLHPRAHGQIWTWGVFDRFESTPYLWTIRVARLRRLWRIDAVLSWQFLQLKYDSSENLNLCPSSIVIPNRPPAWRSVWERVILRAFSCKECNVPSGFVIQGLDLKIM